MRGWGSRRVSLAFHFSIQIVKRRMSQSVSPFMPPVPAVGSIGVIVLDQIWLHQAISALILYPLPTVLPQYNLEKKMERKA